MNAANIASVLRKALALWVICVTFFPKGGCIPSMVQEQKAKFERVELQYGREDVARQKMDLFKPITSDRSPSNLLVFVHGGAWVSESTEMYYDMGAYIAGQSHTAVALIEYRLTKRDESNTIWHPDHLDDVHAALRMLFSEDTMSSHGYTTQHSALVGHSAGAWMALTVALDSHRNQASFPPLPVRTISPLDDLICSAFRVFVCAEPIISIVDMLNEYPSYDYFVKPAFFSPNSQQKAIDTAALQKVEPARWPLRSTYANDTKIPTIHVIASNADTLLSQKYTQRGIEILRKKGIDPVIDLETYTGDHGQILQDPSFMQHLIDIMSIA